jgi:hypothetical protein
MAYSENRLENMPNQYYQFVVDSDLGVGKQFIEFDSEGWAIRQCEEIANRWFNSTMGTWHPETGGLAKLDQQLTEGGKALGLEITAETFEEMWEKSQ